MLNEHWIGQQLYEEMVMIIIIGCRLQYNIVDIMRVRKKSVNNHMMLRPELKEMLEENKKMRL